MSYPRIKSDVYWLRHKGNSKRPVAYSTVATSDFLALIHEQRPFFSINQLKELINDKTQYIYNPDANAVLNAYIKAGEGDIVPQWH